jgi:DNA-binding transcriptional LysR family regulator
MAQIVDWDDHIGRRLRLRDLRVFFIVVQSGSFAKAAAQLRVSQPAVSQVIAELEHSLDAKLFDRSRRGVEPTVYAHALLSRGRAAFDELKQGIRDIEFLADPGVGELRIGSTTATTDTLLPVFIQPFSQLYPRVVLHIEDTPRPALDLSGLRDRKFDLILARWMTSPADDRLLADFNVEILFHDQLVIAAGAHNAWARRRKIDLRELVEEPWILAEPNSWNYARLVEAFRARGLGPPKPSLVTFSISLRTHLLANGPYITSFPNSSVQFNPNQRSLKVLPVRLPVRPWPFAILTLKNRTLSPIVERFIECAREVTKSIIRSSQNRVAQPLKAHFS